MGAATLLGAALTLAAPGSAQAAGQPIRELRFDWTSYRKLAAGSDNWPLTWCEDDHQYTSWGDGGGFGGTNTSYRVSLGFARVMGDYPGFTTQNLWGGREPLADAEFSGKVQTLLCVEGRLYGWHSPSSEVGSFLYKQLIVSEDKGLSWQRDALPQTRVNGCEGCPGLPYMINYGRNYELNRDGYVYTYWIAIQNIELWGIQKPGIVWLMRAPVANQAFTDPARWRWLAGFDENGRPRWGELAERVPVLEEPGGTMRNSAVWVPGLERHLMVVNHTKRNSGKLAIWESPEPWGPWTQILRDDRWPESDPAAPVEARFSFGNFGPRWFSSDGRSGAFVWFGPDGWNSVAVEIVPEDAPPVPVTGSPGLFALGLGLLASASFAVQRVRRARQRALVL